VASEVGKCASLLFEGKVLHSVRTGLPRLTVLRGPAFFGVEEKPGRGF